ncbi:endo-alpha-N-acetylgalactosaminidase family protein [Ruania alba]|uniref:Endo-alpha-N-acetylgalactosaminidase n=1 Tax=Ruania alba TaxID=648782 RepID=A0A1H5DBK8_9MICO|nr:endo-alpha-N-acetylgalactosaminidase family protein [Ruania alba]SED76295.1 endo-alpha-N-acetylgalactosaminidase [Ruania alba]
MYFAGDLNGDGHVTWHDGGIRARDVVPERLGAERVPERVVNRIPFNFASQATNPFEMTLDNTIRLANSTDELGQWVLEKGFGAEGHDSANTDYGGNYNERAGGLAELNELVDLGADLNADFTVHVNATEIYPQANSFDPAILQTSTNPSVGPHPYGWNWLDQSYYIDQDVDLGTGQVLDRFEQLSEEVPNLSGVYIDVYYSSGWVAEELADELTAMDLEIGTEWSDKFVGNAVWAHWPNDLNYGGATNKGINSTMVRFIHNSDADIWNADPVLGNQRLVDAEGWTGNRDWNTFYEAIWTTSLPTKFVQHFDLLTWEPGTSASLTGDVAITMDSEERVITLGGAEVLRGDDYLLPWQSLATNEETGSPLSADKMYFFTLDGGDRTFDLTERFAEVSSFDVYQLTDTGRVHTGTVTPDGGTLTLTGDAATPYVVVPAGDQPLNDPLPYGAASELADPGFNSGSLEPWNARGPVELDVNAIGDNVATFGPGRSSISQQVTGLEPGQQYTFSAHVEIAHDALRPVTVGVTSDGEEVENTFDLTPAQNKVQADAKRETYSQRASVSFTAPDSGEVTVQIAAEPGRSEVTVDAARVFVDTTTDAPADLVAHEDFEGNQPGWGPFYKGPAGGSNDPRTSISVRNDPYTSAEWRNTVYPHHETGPQPGMAIDTVLDGDHSLSVHNDKVGLLMRTAPSSVSFEEGHRYRVELDYQTNGDGAFRWVVGGDEIADGALSSITVDTVPIPQSLQTSTFSHEFTGGCGQAWVGLERLPGNAADLVLDNVRITDLGEDPAGATCATLETPDQVTLNPATANVVTTTFTNTEDETVTNVGAMLDTPEGWLVQVAEGSTNLVETLEPDESMSTNWVLTPPAEAAGTTEALQVQAQYLHGCTKTVTADLTANTATRSRIPSEAITVTASSEETNVSPTRGPAVNMLDGDPSSIWHSRWTSDATSYPHVLTFDLGTEQALDGISYLRRPANQNGPIKDYLVEVSSDGETWTQVAEGAWENTDQYQDVDFDEVTTRYVRVTALSSISGTQFAAVAEMVFYGDPGAAPAAHDPQPLPEDDYSACTAPPAVEVEPGRARAGAEVSVTLTGFPAESEVTLALDEETVGTAVTDAEGSAVATVTVPAETEPGPRALVAAESGGGASASTELLVIPRGGPSTG